MSHKCGHDEKIKAGFLFTNLPAVQRDCIRRTGIGNKPPALCHPLWALSLEKLRLELSLWLNWTWEHTPPPT